VTRKFFQRKRAISFWALIILAVMLLGLGEYGIFIEPYNVVIRHVWVKDSGLGKALRGTVAVHLSDLHIRDIGKRERKVLAILKALEPDLIFLTGDYMAWKECNDFALTFLARLETKRGVWAVMGDYDYSRSRQSCLFCHETGSGKPNQSHPVRFLRNELVEIDIGRGSVWIGGIDLEGELPFVSENSISHLEGTAPAIILSHDPLNFELLDEDQDLLMLSGDTHGGQIPLPSWLWGLLGYEKCAKYNYGLFEKGKKKLFVSKGVGTSHFPIRILRRPEVVVLHFEEAEGREHRAWSEN